MNIDGLFNKRWCKDMFIRTSEEPVVRRIEKRPAKPPKCFRIYILKHLLIIRYLTSLHLDYYSLWKKMLQSIVF